MMRREPLRRLRKRHARARPLPLKGAFIKYVAGLPAAPDRRGPAPLDVLVFECGDEQFGIDVGDVRECVHYRGLGAVADGAALVKGVALWRGAPLALLDLRAGAHASAPAPLAEVVVLMLARRLVGIVVDRVIDVIRLGADQVRPLRAPAMDGAAGLTGIGSYRRRRLLLLDVAAFISGADAGAPAAAPKRAA